MFLYCVDETSSDSRGDFFVFGGVTIPDHAVSELVKIVDDTKKDFRPISIPREVEIKWNYQTTRQALQKSIKQEISREQHTELKSKILAEVAKRGRDDIGIYLYVVPYKFFVNNGWQSYQMAMNVCFGKFENYLAKKNQYGIVLIDELEGIKTKDEEGGVVHLTKNQLRGHILFYVLNLYESGTGKTEIPHIPLILPNVISTLSGLHQINDLVIGAFQYYLQYAFQSGPERTVAVNTVKTIVRNFHVNFESPDKVAALNCGLNIYPQNKNESWSNELKTAFDLVPALKQKLSEDFNLS